MPRKTRWQHGLLSSDHEPRATYAYSGMFRAADVVGKDNYPDPNPTELYAADHSSLPAVGYSQQFSQISDSRDGHFVPRLSWDGSKWVQDGGILHVRSPNTSTANAISYGWTGSTFSSTGEEQPEDSSMDLSGNTVSALGVPYQSGTPSGNNGPGMAYNVIQNGTPGEYGAFTVYPTSSPSLGNPTLNLTFGTVNNNDIQRRYHLRDLTYPLYKSSSRLQARQAVPGANNVVYMDSEPAGLYFNIDPVTHLATNTTGVGATGFQLFVERRIQMINSSVIDGGMVRRARIVAHSKLGSMGAAHVVGPRLYTMGLNTNTDNNKLFVTHSFSDSLTCTATEFDTFVTSVTQDATANISATQKFSDAVASPSANQDFRFTFTGAWSASGELRGDFLDYGRAEWDTTTASRFVQLAISPEHWSEMSGLASPKIYLFGRYISGSSSAVPNKTTRNGYTITHTGSFSPYLMQCCCAYYVPSLNRGFMSIMTNISNHRDTQGRAFDMTAAAKEYGLF